ncbi:hypothetical protein SAMD00019534_028210 [Acytostelium subglobosum LB1]|uniref:hypothetical protein n=1 Tax=Acytostelium subglobosum LB1 TaxID=1410327 RepID=UPI000644E356|nr:hypothetical protein SAMD00019534_028210 [Acytostelium subglobosum LB1]GAM19646.1 hypothetical protein SAMD00019534_028210 [Acytostelium subglobosum LB1]|eukprot:XP_012756408.1 hypothetical protein SAMD00019534_028210 [Acytostelium subglobosum LB1]
MNYALVSRHWFEQAMRCINAIIDPMAFERRLCDDTSSSFQRSVSHTVFPWSNATELHNKLSYLTNTTQGLPVSIAIKANALSQFIDHLVANDHLRITQLATTKLQPNIIDHASLATVTSLVVDPSLFRCEKATLRYQSHWLAGLLTSMPQLTSIDSRFEPLDASSLLVAFGSTSLQVLKVWLPMDCNMPRYWSHDDQDNDRRVEHLFDQLAANRSLRTLSLTAVQHEPDDEPMYPDVEEHSQAHFAHCLTNALKNNVSLRKLVLSGHCSAIYKKTVLDGVLHSSTITSLSLVNYALGNPDTLAFLCQTLIARKGVNSSGFLTLDISNNGFRGPQCSQLIGSLITSVRLVRRLKMILNPFSMEDYQSILHSVQAASDSLEYLHIDPPSTSTGLSSENAPSFIGKVAILGCNEWYTETEWYGKYKYPERLFSW